MVLNFSIAIAKLELGLDPDSSGQELLAREGDPNQVIHPLRRYLSKVRTCTLTEETTVTVSACHSPLMYRSLCRDNHVFLMGIMSFAVSLPGARGKRRTYAGKQANPQHPDWSAE